jgi:hypothetical protein
MMYIRATGIVSPQGAFGEAPVAHAGNRLHCVEPDYATLIEPKLIRRMSRIIRMGVAAGVQCLRQAGISPDAIITGTAYGCLEDTTVFLQRMVDNKEEMLTPTAFIQSTHNTVGAQIALMLQCHGYNNTFVHRGFSFESALLDAQMLLEDGEADTVLVGGVDEITDTSHSILSRFGLYKQAISSNLELFNAPGKGTINGEGAAFFLLSRTPGPGVKLSGPDNLYKPSGTAEILSFIGSFLDRQGLQSADLDLVLTGRNGNLAEERGYDAIETAAFPGTPIEPFKQLCGEYPTASAFGLWLASAIAGAGQARRILLYNHYQNIHHALYLVSC